MPAVRQDFNKPTVARLLKPFYLDVKQKVRTPFCTGKLHVRQTQQVKVEPGSQMLTTEGCLCFSSKNNWIVCLKAV